MALRRREAQPRAEDYPVSDGVPMDNEQHRKNISHYLTPSFELWCELTGYTAFVGSNSFVYYGPRRKHDVVGPDLYVVNGGRMRGQACWISALEGGLKPSLVMEFMSDSTRVHDQTKKLELYRDVLRCRDYFLVDDGPTVRGFHRRGSRYAPIEPDARGHLACASLPLKVGVHDGWVRWFDAEGRLVPTPGEFEAARADAEARRAEAEARRAEAEARRAEAEAERAEAEAERADAAVREAERLRAEIERLKRQLEDTSR